MTGTGIHVLCAPIAIAGPVRPARAMLLSHRPPPDPLDSLSVVLEFLSGVSATLAAVRSTPMHLRVHAFGRNGSAEALGRIELDLLRSSAEPQHLSFPHVESVRVNPDSLADAVTGRTPCPAAFEAITEAVEFDAGTTKV